MTLTERKSNFKPTPGSTYENHGGGTYLCLRVYESEDKAIMQNIASGWTCICYGIGFYFDQTIDWDWSTGGHFEEIA